MAKLRLDTARRPVPAPLVAAALVGLALAALALLALSPRGGGHDRPAREAQPCRLPQALVAAGEPAAAALDELARRAAGFGFSGSVLLTRGERVLLRAGYGLADAAAGFPNTPGTVFEVGSLNKQFLAAAALLLERERKLQLDDPIAAHLVGVPQDKRAITIEQLLTHTAGLPGDFPVEGEDGLYYEALPRAAAVARILAMPLDAPPGGGWSYSNVGYDLVGAILERRAGRPLRDLLRERLFVPAGMDHTEVWGLHFPAVDASCVAVGHDELGPRVVDVRRLVGETFLTGVVSTVDDLHAWQRALRAGRILAPGDVARLTAPRAEEYAYGWFVRDTPHGRRVSHGGDWHGFGSWLGWYEGAPARSLALAVLTNRNHQGLGGEHMIARLAQQLALGEKAEMYAGERFDLPPESAPLGAELEARLVGTYRLADGSALVVEPGAFGGLQIAARGQAAADALGDASAAERAERAALTARVVRMVEEAAAGRDEELRAAVPQAPRLANYRRAFAGALEECAGERGGLGRIEADGTTPAVHPHGELTTTLNLHCARRGEASLRVSWSEGGLVQFTGPAELLLAPTPLRQGAGGELVAWSPVFHRALRLEPVRDAGGAIVELRLRGAAGPAVTARRDANARGAAAAGEGSERT